MSASFPTSQTVLVVDDTPANIYVLSYILRQFYKVKAALNGERALAIASIDPVPDLILLDVMMPGIDGYEVLRRLRQSPKTEAIPVLFVSALSSENDEHAGLALGAVDYITKPISPSIVLALVRIHLSVHHLSQELGYKVLERTEELQRTRLEVIRRLGRAAEFRDNETGLYVIRMSHYARLMSEATTTDRTLSDLFYNAAPMHDVGKIGVPDHILLKPGKLSQEEWHIMRTHPVIGGEIIGSDPSPLMQMSRTIALCHHEKWDGTGYPNGVKGADIPLAARLVSLADVFDALTTERPYISTHGALTMPLRKFERTVAVISIPPWSK